MLHMQEEAEFADGDDYHSSENLRKMSSGQPLTDEVCFCALPYSVYTYNDVMITGPTSMATITTWSIAGMEEEGR